MCETMFVHSYETPLCWMQFAAFVWCFSRMKLHISKQEIYIIHNVFCDISILLEQSHVVKTNIISELTIIRNVTWITAFTFIYAWVSFHIFCVLPLICLFPGHCHVVSFITNWIKFLFFFLSTFLAIITHFIFYTYFRMFFKSGCVFIKIVLNV